MDIYKNIQDQFKQVVEMMEDENKEVAEATFREFEAETKIEEMLCCPDCESKISMGEDVGWISGPHDAIKAVQKLIIDGEGYRKDIHELGAGLKALAIEYEKLAAENKALESKREYDIEVMRTAQGLLKDGAQGTIVDTVWVSDDSNTTLWELLEMAIDGG